MNNIKGLIRNIYELIAIFVSRLNYIIPKNKRNILIYNSTFSLQNNYAMYLYLIDNHYHDKYNIIYSMPNLPNKSENKNVRFITSKILTVYYYLISKTVFLDNSNLRIKPSKCQNVINLWHGTPLKRIGFMSKTLPPNMNKNSLNAFSKIVVSSSLLDNVYKKSFNIEKSMIMHDGQPRNNMFRNEKNRKDVLSSIGIIDQYDEILMWMTTYRESKDGRLKHTNLSNWSDTNLPLLKSMNKFEEINEELKKNNQLLIIKYHTTGKIPEEVISSNSPLTNIKFLTEDGFFESRVHLYEIISKCDALITDYSSIYIDFLLLDKQIAFIIEDIEEYEEVNGFNFQNVLDYMPGEKIVSMDELKLFLRDLTLGKDKYITQRREVCSILNEFHSDDNCKNILNSIDIK